MDIFQKCVFWFVIFVLFFGAFHLFSSFYAAHCIYIATLKRKTKEQWGRDFRGESELQEKMFQIGEEWQRENKEFGVEVHTVRDGLNLYGEYYNRGTDKAVLVLSGRTDTLKYGYFFAKPYWETGYNVLVIDSRAHGKSDGVYNTVGFEEGKDAIAWTELLLTQMNVNFVVFHGICIGAAAGTYAITSPDCPECVSGLVGEGMFIRFGESMRNHLIERKRLWFPVMQCIDFWMKKYTGHSMMKGPLDVADKMTKPILMLQSLEDKYSTPENAEKLYKAFASEDKKLVLFEKGGHSMVRINNMEKYDFEIKEFLRELEHKQDLTKRILIKGDLFYELH